MQVLEYNNRPGGRNWSLYGGDTLVELGMWDDTIVIVTSDHGEQLGDQGTIGKGGLFEASYHIPGIVRDPRHVEAHGTVIDAFTENVDLLPTICEAIVRFQMSS